MTEVLEGLRQRKRRETKERIEKAALALFLSQGFEATTLDTIAAAADVSRRTVFHYFSSKDAIVEAQESQYERALLDGLLASSASSPFGAAQDAILQALGRFESQEALAIERMMRSSPQLMGRKPANWARKEQLIYEGLSRRWPDPDRSDVLRLAAMASIGAFRLATEAWSASDGSPALSHWVRDAFDRLKRELT